MTFTSKTDWDTDIASVGGQNNVLLVESPYSNLASANAAQGTLTYGNLTTEYAPPKLSISSIDNGYYIHSRMNTNDINDQAGSITKMPDEAQTVSTAPVTQGKENFKECMRGKTYVGPSRRGTKNTLNPARGNVTEAQQDQDKEEYTEIAGLVGSNVHVEAFTTEGWVTCGKVLFSIVIIIVALLVVWCVFKCINKAKPGMLPYKLASILRL